MNTNVSVVPFYHNGELYFGNVWSDQLRVRTSSRDWQPLSDPGMIEAFHQAKASRENRS